MAPPKKYLDFSERRFSRMSKVNARDANDMRAYVGITCPHCNIEFVDIPEYILSTDKSAKCILHLRVCEAARAAGVHAPPRKRRATQPVADLVETQTVDVRSVERGALGVQNGQLVETMAELAVKEKELRMAVESEARLVAKNEDLRGRLSRLEERMDERLRHVDAQLAALSHVIGLPTPPIPTMETLIDKADGLVRKSNMRDSESEKLRSEINRLHAENSRLRYDNTKLQDANPFHRQLASIIAVEFDIVVKDQRSVDVIRKRIVKLKKASALTEKTLREQEIKINELITGAKEKNEIYDLVGDFLHKSPDATAFLRKVSLASHPDKHCALTEYATSFQKLINGLIEKCR